MSRPFRVVFRLCFKGRLSVTSFIRKLVLFTCKWTELCMWIKLILIFMWKTLPWASLKHPYWVSRGRLGQRFDIPTQGRRVAPTGGERPFSLTAPGSDPQPGIEPGPHWWESDALPIGHLSIHIYHFCFFVFLSCLVKVCCLFVAWWLLFPCSFVRLFV